MRSAEERVSDLGLAGEQEWLYLRRHFELADDPWIGFVFCPAPGPVATLRERTDFMLRHRAKQLRRINPRSPEALRTLMPQLFESLPQADCIWVEAIAVDGPLSDDEVGPWAGAWDWLMLRLNERRDALRRQLKGALVLAVHPTWKPRVRDAAPDFWSVRSLVIDLAGNESAPQIERPSVSETKTESEDDGEYVPSVEAALAAVNRLAATPSPDPQSLGRLHMRAASALLKADRASEAAEQADQALGMLRGQNARLRAQALIVAGRVKRTDDDMGAARHHLEEAVRLRKSMLAEHGDLPQVLRDLSVAHFELAGLYVDAGNAKAARAACEESLALDRQLMETTGETPQALRDLSVSLHRTGDIHGSAGDAAAAKAAYTESLAIARRLAQTTGETPQALRDLSVSLHRMGDIHGSAGDAAAAKAAYEESLVIRRRLAQTTGETPQTLRDLSVSLARMGDIHDSAGDTVAAKAAYDESLALRRRLETLFG